MVLAGMCVAVLVVGGCSSDSSSEARIRVRRSQHRETTTSPSSTKQTTTTAAQATIPVTEIPYVPGAQIGELWTQGNLCDLVPIASAQKILKMTTEPTPRYSFSEVSGARCTYSNGAGNEIYIEYSTSTYADARAVDIALNKQGTAIVVEGVGGVSKTSSALGVTYELNISGASSNQWVVNTQKDDTTRELAGLVIASVRK